MTDREVLGEIAALRAEAIRLGREDKRMTYAQHRRAHRALERWAEALPTFTARELLQMQHALGRGDTANFAHLLGEFEKRLTQLPTNQSGSL
jgi:hypothetical protein